MAKQRTLTGYRPTGKLHLGHWFGNLQNMLQMQHDYDAYYFIADWHALTTHWADPGDVRAFSEEMVLDWVAAGLDPEICTIYRQSDVPEVAELTLYFSMVTPMPWLERVPSYKEQRDQITDKDLGNVGFFLYPALQAADITIVLADAVPVGEDQLPHLELTREIVGGSTTPTATISSSRRPSSPSPARAFPAPTGARCRRATATRSSSRTPRTSCAPRRCRS